MQRRLYDLDLERLRIEIRVMRRHEPLYKVLKEELSARGYWKNRARGNPIKAYAASLARKQKEV